MSQTVREIVEKSMFTVEYEDGEAIDVQGDGGFSVFTSRAEAQDALDSEVAAISEPEVSASLRVVEYSALAGHVLASTEPEEKPISKTAYDTLLRDYSDALKVAADLRDQLQAATMRAEAAEGDTRMMDGLQLKCGTLMGDLKAAQQRIENQRTELRQKNAEVALGIAQSESYLRIIKSGQQLADERGKEIEQRKSGLQDALAHYREELDERGREVERLRAALNLGLGALRESSQATIETLKSPGRMNGLNVHARRAHQAIQDALATPAATPPAKPSFRETLRVHGIPPLSEERQTENLRAEFGIDPMPPAHVYTSTACLHGLHDRCRKSCKFCGVDCACSCHATEATPPAQEHSDTARDQFPCPDCDTGYPEGRICRTCGGRSTVDDDTAVANHPPFIFDRYRNGVRMAEGAKIHHAATAEEAEAIARKLFEREESCPWDYTGPCTDEFRLRDTNTARTGPEARR